jgi:hypothetical protein
LAESEEDEFDLKVANSFNVLVQDKQRKFEFKEIMECIPKT